MLPREGLNTSALAKGQTNCNEGFAPGYFFDNSRTRKATSPEARPGRSARSYQNCLAHGPRCRLVSAHWVVTVTLNRNACLLITFSKQQIHLSKVHRPRGRVAGQGRARASSTLRRPMVAWSDHGGGDRGQRGGPRTRRRAQRHSLEIVARPFRCNSPPPPSW